MTTNVSLVNSKYLLSFGSLEVQSHVSLEERAEKYQMTNQMLSVSEKLMRIHMEQKCHHLVGSKNPSLFRLVNV